MHWAFLERWRGHLRLTALTRGDRVEATARVRDAFIEAGAFITDAHLFGGMQTTLGFEVEAHHLADLERALADAGVRLDADSVAQLHEAAAHARGELEGTLALVFVRGDPDIRHEVPSVPG
ncbi:MAG: hypothetical protein KC619_21785 [Myxococcales bacterium]|nr:hypothetical protein [Myxococcales bacterium]